MPGCSIRAAGPCNSAAHYTPGRAQVNFGEHLRRTRGFDGCV